MPEFSHEIAVSHNSTETIDPDLFWSTKDLERMQTALHQAQKIQQARGGTPEQNTAQREREAIQALVERQDAELADILLKAQEKPPGEKTTGRKNPQMIQLASGGNIDIFFQKSFAFSAAKLEGKTQEADRLRRELEAEFGDTEEVFASIQQATIKNRELYLQQLAAKKVLILAESDEEGGLAQLEKLTEKSGKLSSKELASEQVAFLRTIRDSKRQNKLRQLQEREREIKKSVQTIDDHQQKEEKQVLIESAGNMLAEARMDVTLSQLNKEQLGVILALATTGAADLAGALLLSNLKPASQGIGVSGTIEGEEVTAVWNNNQSVQCSLEHDGKKIPIDLKSADGFNQAVRDGIAGAVNAASLQKESSMREQIYKKIFHQIGSHFMTGEETTYTERILGSLLKGAGSAAEELEVLRKLHLVTADGKPNQKFLAWWALEFRLLAEQTSTGSLLDSTSLEALQAIAEKWNQENKLTLMNLNTLAMLPTQTPKETSPERVGG